MLRSAGARGWLGAVASAVMSRERDEQAEFDEEPAGEEADDEFEDDEPDEDVEPADDQRQKARSKGVTWLVLGVAVVAACCIGGVVKGCGGGGSPQDEKVSAISGCEELVKDRLKAPSTAEFSNEAADGGDGSYVVDGDVDSENSFGAMLRSHFTCTVHSAGDQWELDSMQIE